MGLNRKIVPQIFQKPTYSHDIARLISASISLTIKNFQQHLQRAKHFFCEPTAFLLLKNSKSLGGFTSNKKTVAFIIIGLQIIEGANPQNGKANRGRSDEEIKPNR